MKKITIHEQVCRITNEKRPITFGDIYELQNKKKFEIDDTCYITSGYEDAEWTENTGHNGYYFLTLYREREETDKEYEKRVNQIKEYQKHVEERQYKQYLELKEKFEK